MNETTDGYFLQKPFFRLGNHKKPKLCEHPGCKNVATCMTKDREYCGPHTPDEGIVYLKKGIMTFRGGSHAD